MAGRNLVGPEAGALDLGVVFRALADEHRRSVMTQLAADRSDGERGCNSFDLPVSKQTQTHHVRVLREAGLIDGGSSRSWAQSRRAVLLPAEHS
ncbi:ArsR/SmtB family transcription factor [Streptomyces tendae]